MAAEAIKRIKRISGLPPRRRDAHKGDFGRVLIIGGSRGMIGAPALAAQAALRSGAGLVTVACPKSIQLAVASLCPCATTIPLSETRDGIIAPAQALRELKSAGVFHGARAANVIVGGPGLGQGGGEFARRLMGLWSAAMKAGIPLVLDADALNALSRSRGSAKGEWELGAWRKTIITPHPGELARMLGIESRTIQSDREGWARRTVNQMSSTRTGSPERPVIVLKGARTVVTDGRRMFVNTTGNPGMSTGGSGDVLTGIIAALIGQGMSCFDAAGFGAFIHGRAGDIAARKMEQVSLIASDLIEALPAAFRLR